MANKKLTEEQITDIVKLYSNGETLKNISIRYGVHVNTISYVVRKNGLGRQRRVNGEYSHLSITIDKSIADQLSHHRGQNISKLISSLLDKWLRKHNVPECANN